jgi:hypothetical protein
MKRLTPLLGLAAAGLAGLSATAQQFNYNNGDLILDFSKAGSADLEVDIGNVSQFTSQTPGTTVTVGGYSINSQLLSTFGGSLSGVQFSVFGTDANTPVDYLTLRRSTPSVQNPAPGDFTSSKLNTVSSDIQGIIGSGASKGILPWSAGNPADPVANTTTAVVIPTSGVAAVNSFSSLYNASGGLKSALAAPGIVNTAGTGSVSDLFAYAGAGSSTPSTFLGDFSFNTDGSVSFSTVAVPEPATYGLLAGAGLLMLTLRSHVGRILKS